MLSDPRFEDKFFNQAHTVKSSNNKGILKKNTQLREIFRTNSLQNKSAKHRFINLNRRKVQFSPETNFNFKRISENFS